MNSLGKNTLITAAVAAAMASQAAFAISPTSSIDFSLYAAGGSAQTNAFYTAANTILSSLDSFTSAATADDASYRIVTGTTAKAFSFNNVTIAAGKNVLYFYKFNGGSFPNGVNPQVVAGGTLTYPTVASVLAATLITPAPTLPGAPTYHYASTLGNIQQPDWGVADVEVPMFQGFNKGSTSGIASNTDGGAPVTVGASTGIYDNLFGIAVTHVPSFFTGAHPKTSFSKAEIEGIIAGTTSDWSQLAADDGTELAAGGIIFIDRGQGSGTKASGNQYFLNYPGDVNGGNKSVIASATFPGSAVFGYTATQLSTAGGEVASDIAEGSTSAIINDLLAAQAAGLRAIAVLGLENPPALHPSLTTPAGNGYDFVKINGRGVDTAGASDYINGTVATSYINVVKGEYDFYYKNSFNTRAALNTGTTTGVVFANEFAAVMSTPAFVGAFSGKAFPTAVPGTLIDPDITGVTLTSGVVLNSRKHKSPAALQSALSVGAGGIPVSKEPL